MFYVFRGINRTKKEVYFGVTDLPLSDNCMSCLVYGTKAIRHWNYDRDDIRWISVSNHRTKQTAEAKAQKLQKTYLYRGQIDSEFINIITLVKKKSR